MGSAVDAIKREAEHLRKILSECETVSDLRNLEAKGIKETFIRVLTDDEKGEKDWQPLNKAGDKDSVYGIWVSKYGNNLIDIEYIPQTDELTYHDKFLRLQHLDKEDDGEIDR